jgi:hypothetical protein
MGALDFSGIDAKLRRAQFHREHLAGLVEHDIRDERYRAPLRAELDAASGYHVFQVLAVPTG